MKLHLKLLILLLVVGISACKKEKEQPNPKPLTQTSTSNVGEDLPTINPDACAYLVSYYSTHKQVAPFEWNGVKGEGARCYCYPCDCVNTASPCLTVPEGLQDLMNEFEIAYKKDDIREWYISGRGQQVLPLPEQQLKDIKDGLVTFKKFPDDNYQTYHLVYTDAVSISDRPDYSIFR